MLSRILCRIAALGCIGCLSACAVGPDYVPPQDHLRDTWSAFGDKTSADIKVSNHRSLPGAWWRRFHDATLSSLVTEALAGNHDLKVAKARIAEARANAGYASSQLWPEIDANASVTRSAANSAPTNELDTVTQLGANGDWDIDPFGANWRQREAAGYGTEAAKQDYAQARINLIADVVRNYSHLRAAQAQRQLVLNNLKTQRDTLRITNALRKVQDVTDLDVARVHAQIAASESRLPQIRTDIYAAMNRLCVLTGKQPGDLYSRLLPPGPMLALPANLVVSSPVATIAQRPDVHAAERRLAQASALSDAAFAQIFPHLSITAFYGEQHSKLFGALSPWSATVQGLFPLLDFGRIREQMKSADARQLQAFHIYKQTVLLALEDTENSLDSYTDERRRNVFLRKVAEEQGRAVGIATKQYKGGIVTQLDLLDAERNQLDSQSNRVTSEQTTIDSLIQLYHSLGQGAPVAAPTPD